MKKNQRQANKNNYLKVYLTIGAVFCVYFLLLAISAIFFEDRFGLNSTIAGVNVSLMSRNEAESALINAWNKYRQDNIIVSGQKYPVENLISNVDTKESISEALKIQQQGYLKLDVLWGVKNGVMITANDENLSKLLGNKYDELSIAPENARISIDGSPKVFLEKRGRRLLLPESREAVVDTLSLFGMSTNYVTTPLEVSLTSKEAESLLGQVQNLTSEPVTLSSERGNFEISTAQLRSWLKITPVSPNTVILAETLLPSEDTINYNYLDPYKITTYVKEIAGKINQNPENAKLSVQNGQIVVTKQAVTGYALDELDVVSNIQGINADDRNIALKIATTPAEVREDNLATLGLKELVSTGWSNFAGSPNNRIHNVKTGASKFNGVLIKPGEDFSFNKALGPVEAYTGYLPELVILQNKTVPQYGGGLCQVSSTAFRAALNAGLPILERTMHAYPVSYYKPYGVDATIYLPKPDLVFTNDTGSYIMIQTRVEGTKLFFDFYGTKPARTVKFAGDKSATGAVDVVENVSPAVYDAGARGRGSFTATFYRFIYDGKGALSASISFTSKYDSPDKYPH
ncbi:MAG: VanW family protein [Patescibacteria group bacterium]|jgi:vancomycin resistance protein YoaR|nr:VanW family protein [Patescibacteria group bacterium]